MFNRDHVALWGGKHSGDGGGDGCTMGMCFVPLNSTLKSDEEGTFYMMAIFPQ